jgi:hypothetical protein
MITEIENTFWSDLEFFLRNCKAGEHAPETERIRLRTFVRQILSELPKESINQSHYKKDESI